ncbi:MAG: type II toxin-antitoxin system PemK/MazF family toxin [Promethearchaeota archaeon]
MERVSLILQRDLILLPFPFSNLSGNKVRPVVVISNSSFNAKSQDVIVAAVTSNISGQNKVLLTSEDLIEGFLKHDSCVKVENILKISKLLVIKKIGRINSAKHLEIVQILQDLLELDGENGEYKK